MKSIKIKIKKNNAILKMKINEIFKKKPGRPKKLVSNQSNKKKQFQEVILVEKAAEKQTEPGIYLEYSDKKTKEFGSLWVNKFKSLVFHLNGKGVNVEFKDNWLTVWLTQLPKLLCLEFLNLQPNLNSWSIIFLSKTPRDTLNFVFGFLAKFGLTLHPNIIAGRSLRTIVFLYYINYTKRYLIYNRDSQLFYQYKSDHFEMVTEGDIINDAIQFSSSFQVADCAKVFYKDPKGLFQELIPHISIERWPKRSGISFKNGFFHIHNGKYTLANHHPGQWQKSIIGLEIPESIVPTPTNLAIRFLLDLGSEQLKSINLLKLWFFYCLQPGHNNLLFNITGNPRSSKSLLLKILAKAFPSSLHQGDLGQLNSFQLKDLIVNAGQVAFPDSNPGKLTRQSIDILKRLTGGDSIRVEEKFGSSYSIRGQYTIMIINNENFEEVQAYKDPAMADRVLNIQLSTIATDAVVQNLFHHLETTIPYLFLFALDQPIELIKKSQRAQDINAAMGSGIETPLVSFIQGCLVFEWGSIVKASDVFEEYHKFIERQFKEVTVQKRYKYTTKQGFNQHFLFQINRMDKSGVEKKRSRVGIIFVNFRLEEHNGTHVDRFMFASTEIDKLLERNPFRMDRITLIDTDGEFITGPKLNPKFNQLSHESLKKTIHSTVKEISTGKPYSAEHGIRHFEATGLTNSKTAHELKETDFDEQEEGVDYQSSLCTRSSSEEDFPFLKEVINNSLTKQLLGEEAPFYIHPSFKNSLTNFSYSRKRINEELPLFIDPAEKDQFNTIINPYNKQFLMSSKKDHYIPLITSDNGPDSDIKDYKKDVRNVPKTFPHELL